MPSTSPWSIACLLLFAASPVNAQPSIPSASPSEIVVTGDRNFKRQVRDFVRALTPARVKGQLGRFENAVCPMVWGLTPEQNRLVEARLIAVAKAANMDVAGKGCHANALLLVNGDKPATIKELRRKRPSVFGNLTPVQIRRLQESPGPAAAWQIVGWVNTAGLRVASGTAMPMGGAATGDDGPVATDGTGLPINFTPELPSLITAPVRPIFDGAGLIIERDALSGLTVTQLADYAAMRLFAKTDPSRVKGTLSILSVIDAPIGSEVPITLTQWDLAFLRGLQDSPANFYARGQRAAITRHMRKDLQTRNDR